MAGKGRESAVCASFFVMNRQAVDAKIDRLRPLVKLVAVSPDQTPEYPLMPNWIMSASIAMKCIKYLDDEYDQQRKIKSGIKFSESG